MSSGLTLAKTPADLRAHGRPRRRFGTTHLGALIRGAPCDEQPSGDVLSQQRIHRILAPKAALHRVQLTRRLIEQAIPTATC